MKTVIIFYEHVSREYQACVNLKMKIEAKSDAKVYIYSFHFQIVDAIILSKHRRIDLLIIPYAYKESSILPIATFINKSPIPIIVNLHHEQVGADFNEFRLFPKDDYTKHRIIHFAWTDLFKKKLENLDIDKSLIFVTGNIRSDLLIESRQISRESFSIEFGLDMKKKWIMLAEGGAHIDSEISINKLVSKGYQRQDLIFRNSETKKAIHRTIKDLNSLSDQFLEKYELIYRAHPGTTTTEDIDVKVKVIDKYSIYDWLNVIDVNVSRLSTTLFESEMANIPTLRYDPTNYPKRLLTYGVDEYRKITNINDINEEIIALAAGDLKTKNIFEKYFGLFDGDSTNRAASIIKKLLNNDNHSYNRSAIKMKYIRYLITKIFSNILSLLIVKYGMTILKKFSQTTIIFKNDIPPSWLSQTK